MWAVLRWSDRTIQMDENRRQTTSEEHIVLIVEPGSKYIGHFVPEPGSAAYITAAMTKYLSTNGLSDSKLNVIGCDGTNTNTWGKGGVITLLEQKLRRPLQWLICQLHANELPLRHLINHLDWVTSGPTGFFGPIGKLCLKVKSYRCNSLNQLILIYQLYWIILKDNLQFHTLIMTQKITLT